MNPLDSSSVIITLGVSAKSKRELSAGFTTPEKARTRGVMLS